MKAHRGVRQQLQGHLLAWGVLISLLAPWLIAGLATSFVGPHQPMPALAQGPALTETRSAPSPLPSHPARAPAPCTPPTPVQNFAVTPGNQTITASWDPPQSDGGCAITTYWMDVQYRSLSPSVYRVAPFVTPLVATVSGLYLGSAYNVWAVAANQAGNSTNYTELLAIPVTVPYPPTEFSASLLGSDSANLSWQSPWSDGGEVPVYYVVQWRQSNQVAWREVSLPRPNDVFGALISGLQSGATYQFRVFCNNSVGAGNPTRSVSLSTPPTTSQWLERAFLSLPWGPAYIAAILGVVILIAWGIRSWRQRKRQSGRQLTIEEAASTKLAPKNPREGDSEG